MLCIRSAQLDAIRGPLIELLQNRQHLDLHPDDREMLEEALKACNEVKEITATDEQRAAAEEIFCKGWGPFADEIEIDDEASVSVADEGYWVSAWVWVPKPKEEVDCGQCEGTGTIEGGLSGDGEDEECPVCDGSGKIEEED